MSGATLNTVQPGAIVTPEAVLLEFDTAGAGSRAAGELLDVALQFFVLSLVAGAAAAADSYVGHTAAAVIALIMVLLVLVGYPVAAETLWNGRTLGKAALGLRVVTVEGGPVRFRHSAIRGIVGLFEIYVTLGSVALFTIIFSRRDQRVGDHMAGTIILRERAAPSHQAMAVTFPTPYGMEGYVASLDVVALTREQYGVIRSFLLRVLDLSPQARWSVAVKLANATALGLRLRPPPGVSPEIFLACVAAAYQRRAHPTPAYGAYPPPVPGTAVARPPGGGDAPGAFAAPPPPGGFAPPVPGTIGARLDAWGPPTSAPVAAPPPPPPPSPSSPAPPATAPVTPPAAFPWGPPAPAPPMSTPPAPPGPSPAPDQDPGATR